LVLAIPAQAGAQGTLDASCAGPRDATASTTAVNHLIAQTFTTLASGRLTEAQIEVQ